METPSLLLCVVATLVLVWVIRFDANAKEKKVGP